jgi:hypothetical protein
MQYPIIIDNGDLDRAFGAIEGYPTTFIVDRNGKITAKYLGMRTRETFEEGIAAVLK